MIHGSCLCKSITFDLEGELQSTGSKKADISKFNSGRGIRCFCSQCGSPLWFESIDHPEIVAIPLGVLDDDEVPTPEMHLWVRSKPGWCAISDDLPQHDTHPR